jgi:hypothetical protein
VVIILEYWAFRERAKISIEALLESRLFEHVLFIPYVDIGFSSHSVNKAEYAHMSGRTGKTGQVLGISSQID